MEYYYNQNKNHGYYDQPTHPTGHAMATAALLLGVGALTTCWTFYFSIILGCLSITFALLSKGFEKKMFGSAKIGLICSVTGIVIAILMLAGSIIYLLQNPGVLLDFGKQTDQMIQQIYGQSTESILGQSYEDMMKQFVNIFS